MFCPSSRSMRILILSVKLVVVICCLYISDLLIREQMASYGLAPEETWEQPTPGMFTSVSVRARNNSQQPQPLSGLACLLTTRPQRQKATIVQKSTVCSTSRIYATVIALTASLALQSRRWIASERMSQATARMSSAWQSRILLTNRRL